LAKPSTATPNRELKTMSSNYKNWIRRGAMVLTIYALGIMEAYYLPRYGIEWMLGAIGVTVFLAGYWVRTNWD
jgi:hypothetical protein